MALIEKGKGTILIQAPEKDLRDALAHASGLGQLKIQLSGESQSRSVIVKDVDKDYLANKLLHVAVLEVAETDVITIDVPIVPIGVPPPVVRHEATLLHPTSHVKLRGKIKDLPEHFEVDVSAFEIHDSISAGDLKVPEGVELLTPIDATLLTIALLKVEEEPKAEAEEVEEGVEGEEGEEKAEEGEE